MTHHIQDKIGDLQAAIMVFKTISPPDAVGRLSVDPDNKRITVNWIRPDETYAWHHPDDESRAKAERDARDNALHFLGVWTTRLMTLTGPDRQVVKNFNDYSVSSEVATEDGWIFKASATADMVCEIVPVLDEKGEQLVEDVEDQEITYTTVTKPVPVTRRVCPPSFLAGVSDEAG